MKIPPWCITPPAALFIRLLSSTLRYEQVNFRAVKARLQQGERLVSALWHGELLPFCRLHANQDVTAVVSQSYDGEIASRILHRFGYHTVRGSSSRGGVAALLGAHDRLTKKGSSVVIVADGPRGPRHRSKPGVFFLAAKAGAMIVPMRVRVSRAKYFEKSWDRFCLPLPGARCRALYGTPYRVETEEMTREGIVLEQDRLDAAMQQLVIEDEKKHPF